MMRIISGQSAADVERLVVAEGATVEDLDPQGGGRVAR